MDTKVRVRFAPSPTGMLHIGNARTALFNYLFAKHHRGIFILRIEDTDLDRSDYSLTDQMLKDLRWLGFDWDEGPDKGGPYGPYRQSERLDIYREYANELLIKGRVYKCFCTPDDLERMRRQQISKGEMPRYDGRCRNLTEEEVLKKESEGSRPALRFHVGRGKISFEDLIHGKMNFDADKIGDFIIIRSDGIAAYNFACVIDDHLMNVSHVIRGEDHLSNTPRQILLYKALGWIPPFFAHHPLILGSDRTPLSKRHGSTAVSQYREEGFLPEALINYLLILGWTSPTNEEVIPMERMIEEFSISSLSRNAPIHSLKKLEWLNGIYIRRKDNNELSELISPYLEKEGLNNIDRDTLLKISDAIKENIVKLSEIKEYLGIFFDEKFNFNEEAKKIILNDKNLKVIETVIEIITSTISDFKLEEWSSFLTKVEEKTGLKGKELLIPIRAGVTGMTKGPQLVKIFNILGKERVLKRLKMALNIFYTN